MSKRIEYAPSRDINRLGERANEIHDWGVEEALAGRQVIGFLLKNPRITKKQFLTLKGWIDGATAYPPDTDAILAGQLLVKGETGAAQ